MLALETYDANDAQFIVVDAKGLQWSTHYGENGGGFGYLRFSLPREIGSSYLDIEYGYRVILRKYLSTTLFDGQIRSIEEVSSPDGDAINITCLGWPIVAEDDEILRAFCDKRLNEWMMDSEIPLDEFRPDLYSFGTNGLGLFAHPCNNDEILAEQFTETIYDFFPDEVAERVKCDFSAVLGAGIAFDGTISTVDDVAGTVVYANDAGEGNVEAGMTLQNITQIRTATVQGIVVGTNTITVETPSSLTGWAVNDELSVIGPLFRAQISGIAADVITYTGEVAEDNLANGQTLANITKKSVATIQAFNLGANTITVTNVDHIDGWENNDVIMVGTSLFYGVITGKAGQTISYGSDIGERVVDVDISWVMYNETEDEFATVDSWPGTGQVTLDAGDDLTNWTNGDVIRIYTPIQFGIYDSDDVLVWPATDAREGAIPHDRTTVNELTAGAPTGFKIRATCLVSGTFAETTFAQLSELRVYSTEDDVTAEMLAKYTLGILSAAGHDWDTDEDDIEAITKVLEPMVFETSSPKEALSWAASFEDGSDNLVAWGIRLDDRKRFYLETQDLDTINYVVRRTAPMEASMGGDIQETAQQVRAIYTDKLGEQQFTAWQIDTDAYFAGHYRRKSIRLDSVDDDDEATTLATQFLDESKDAKRSARYVVHDGAVFTQAGARVPIDEVKALGSLIMIEDWRAVESGASSTDLRNTWAIEQIIGVEVDYDAGTASMIPASARSSFASYMSEIARIKSK